ncbi:glycosyl transferase, group 1, putative [Calothrix sp. PCC 7716]|nr:glycosyl transferase, group 1, putative [Calothrix sp. PCC 7716]
MKILHICAVGFTLKNLLLPQIDYFLSHGVSVEVVCSPGQDVNILQQKGYVIHPIQLARRIDPLANLINIFQLAKLMRDCEYDLVHVHTPIAAVLGRIAAKIAGVKRVVYTAHGFPFHDQSSASEYKFYFTVEKLSALLTDLILTQSFEDLLTAKKLNLCSSKKIDYLGNGIDTERFNRTKLDPASQLQLRHSLNIPDTANLIIGTIGRLTYKKGSGFLIEAIAKLMPEFPNLHTVIIGGQVKGDPEPFQEELIKRIHGLGIEKHVTLTGYRQDTPELLGLLDIFTLPTFTHEGLPRSICEAMAMELPVVSTDIRGCREAVVHRKTGLIVPPRDIDELALALKTLLLDYNLRQIYGRAGRLRVEHEYDECLVFERLKNYYQKIGIKPLPIEVKLSTTINQFKQV